MIIEKVIRTLTSHFDHVIVSIQESNNLETLKLKDLVGSLEAHVIMIVEGKGFKFQYKHYRLRLGINMMVAISSKAKETRLRARSLGRILKSMRLMII